MDQILQSIIAAVLSGSVISATLGIVFNRRGKAIEAGIHEELEKRMAMFESKRVWKEASLSDLLGPINMQLDRTERAFRRYRSKNIYLESKILREGNLTIRDLLLSNGHLIPPDLLEDAGKLIEHFDRWLEEFEKLRLEKNPENDTPFVFVGPKGFPFPRESAGRFQERFQELWIELYSDL